MLIASPLTLLIAAVLAAPALWGALVRHDLEPVDAAIRYLLAVLVAAAMLWVLRTLAEGYRSAVPRRRTSDREPATEAE